MRRMNARIDAHSSPISGRPKTAIRSHLNGGQDQEESSSQCVAVFPEHVGALHTA
jgi:hypothetical protein